MLAWRGLQSTSTLPTLINTLPTRLRLLSHSTLTNMTTATSTTHILAQLRAQFEKCKLSDGSNHGLIDAFLVPTEDAHQSEYTALCDHRRDFVSGFTGSAGSAIVTKTQAALWTDGRYYLQASLELDQNWTLMKAGLPETPKPHEWLAKVLPAGARIGFDPFLISVSKHRILKKQLKASNLQLVPVAENLVDKIWTERPRRPANPVISLDDAKFAGRSVLDKVAWLETVLRDNNCKAIVLSALDEVAWLFNLRGSDVDCNPVFFSYAVVEVGKGSSLFVDAAQVAEHLAQLKANNVTVLPYEGVVGAVTSVAASLQPGERVWIPKGCPYAIGYVVPKQATYESESPIELEKSIKNETELKCMRETHVSDGAALCSYFAWLESELSAGAQYTEVTAADKLEEFRKKQGNFVSLSFPTISGFGSNGAIIHYRPETGKCKTISQSELYLCDSGAQYLGGTTDVTRTVHFGTPTDYEKECFTRVLKGHIALALAVFPTGTPGQSLDALARTPLWDAGLDYRHGTGHGVGAFLNVHEGPHRITFVHSPDTPAGLKAGMIVTNEPGYYEDGKFGIRIENVMVVVPAKTPYNFGSRNYLGFETITLAPIQKKLIAKGLLTDREIAWLNDYHAQVLQKVGLALKAAGDSFTYEWLARETSPL